MNAAQTKSHASSLLPDIFSNRNKQEKSTRQRMKESPQAPSHKVLSRAEISVFRHSLKQNVCVEMLQEGYHRSFSELLSLLSLEQELMESAGPHSAVLLKIPLEEQKEQLETIGRHLRRAEEAERTGSWTEVCKQRLLLGHYFLAPVDLWIRLHFYHSCADRERGGHSSPATEARACMAELYLQQGELEKAKQQAELCVRQAENGGWLDSDGFPLKRRACKTLWRVFSRMADPLLDTEDFKEALTLLHEGHSKAIESEDKQLEAEASHRLGLTYQRAGDHDTAKQFFNSCMEIYSTLGDAEGLGKSYEAMAKSLESEGNINEAVVFLGKLADVSRSNGLQPNLVDAFLYRGIIHYKKSEFPRACEFFLQGYEAACEAGGVAEVEKAKVMVACARARCLIRKHSADVERASPAALRRLLTWKITGRREDLGTNAEEETEESSAY